MLAILLLTLTPAAPPDPELEKARAAVAVAVALAKIKEDAAVPPPFTPPKAAPLSPQAPEGWHSEVGDDGVLYYVKDGFRIYKAPTGGTPRPFCPGGGTPPTTVRPAVAPSSWSGVGIPGGVTTTGALTTARSGLTNCPPGQA